MSECLQSDNSQGPDGGKCQGGGWDFDNKQADTENYAVDKEGYCWCEGDPYPGDSCESYQPPYGNCWRCGESCCECSCVESDAILCDDCDFCDDCGETVNECACDDICFECNQTNIDCECEEE